MGVRIDDRPRNQNVIPLRPHETMSDPLTSPVAATFEPPAVDAPSPEPVQLYGLTVLAFLLHTPTRLGQRCVRCGVAWPCDHLRLAYRLLEGF
jgi:hypothetical protein